jgi:Arc/MetJ family transcription regulator
MSLASETRAAAREHPFLVLSLRADICNYAAAARFLDVDGDVDAVATALRRFEDDLAGFETRDAGARVAMESGLGRTDEDGDDSRGDGLLAVGDTTYAPGEGSLTGVVATGDVDADALASVLRRLSVAGVSVDAAGGGGGALVVVVGRRDGADALRAVEAALDAVPVSDE